MAERQAPGEATPTWRVALAAAPEAVSAFEAALAGLGGAIVTEAPRGRAPVAVQVHLTHEPERARVTALLAAAALAAGTAVPEAVIERLPETDWVAESQKGLPPITAGRFYLHGGHVSEPPPRHAIPLLIEASQAFGTGRHESTRGCLIALSDLARDREVSSALDMGCGSGVLALAVAKLWACPVLAVDNDPQAARVAQENARVNGAADLVRAECGEGYRAPGIRERAPYGLIAANILAEPLCAMAPELIRHLAPGGVAVLSGLLAAQERQVVESHEGLHLLRRVPLGDWVTVVLQG